MEKKNPENSSPIELVLNGGETELNSATFPVEWFFSPELIAKNPQFVVLCDHEGPIDEFKSRVSWNIGNRYLIRAKKLIKYLQMSRPGRHYLVCLVFCGDEKDAEKLAVEYCRGNINSYYKNIFSIDIRSGSIGADTYLTAVEFDVPKELFAAPPDKGLRKLIWDLANSLYEKGPRDECKYRKRILWSPLLAIFYLFIYLVVVLLVVAYTLVGSAVLFLIGFRPKLDNLRQMFLFRDQNWDKLKWNLFKFDELRYSERKPMWRLWKVKFNTNRWVIKKESKWIPKWAVPVFILFELAGIAVVIYFFYWLIVANIMSIIFLLAMFAFFLVLVFFLEGIGRVSKKLKSWLVEKLKTTTAEKELREIKEKKEKEKEAKEREEKYREFLLENASTSLGVPKEIDLENVKKKVDVVTRFQISFWAMKAEACRPFAR